MEGLSCFISEISMLLSGYIYIYTIERKEENYKKVIANLIVFFIVLSLINWLPVESYRWVHHLFPGAGFLYMVYFLYLGWEVTIREAIYYGIWSHVTWQLLRENWIICARMAENMGMNLNLGWGLGFVVYAAGYIIIGATVGRWMPERGKKKIGPRQLSLAVLIFVVFCMNAIILWANDSYYKAEQWTTLYLFQLILAITLYLQNEVFKKSDIKQELEVMNLLWKKEQEQYQLSKENIALINQKCHDLKHQISALRNCRQEDMETYLSEVEESIQIYETIVKTGNEVLDTILTEKSLFCREKGITVSCVADGSQLGFINTIDLYSILGNALDNAMEAVEGFEEKEKKQIDVLIYRQQNFLAINVINPIEKDLEYVDGLPVTTKENKDFHGYGLKSIKYMLKKYDGMLSISDEDGCFSLMMLIPIPKL